MGREAVEMGRDTVGVYGGFTLNADRFGSTQEFNMTTLAFRTAVGGVSIPAGQSKQLGIVDVSKFSKIRVVADERVGAPTGINVRLTITEGNELVAQLDTFALAPHAQLTRVYDVPGAKLTIFADAMGGSGSDGMDLLVYGA
jgi:type III secretion protein HrpB1